MFKRLPIMENFRRNCEEETLGTLKLKKKKIPKNEICL